jgi:hypothetical protein
MYIAIMEIGCTFLELETTLETVNLIFALRQNDMMAMVLFKNFGTNKLCSNDYTLNIRRSAE